MAVDAEAIIDKSTLFETPKGFGLAHARRTTYFRRADFGEPEPIARPAGWHVGSYPWGLQVNVSTGSPDKPELELGVRPERVAMLVLAVFALWWLTRVVCVAVWRWRGARRVARGRCPQCGYEIGRPAS